jgi:hypothetical protein
MFHSHLASKSKSVSTISCFLAVVTFPRAIRKREMLARRFLFRAALPFPSSSCGPSNRPSGRRTSATMSASVVREKFHPKMKRNKRQLFHRAGVLYQSFGSNNTHLKIYLSSSLQGYSQPPPFFVTTVLSVIRSGTS